METEAQSFVKEGDWDDLADFEEEVGAQTEVEVVAALREEQQQAVEQTQQQPRDESAVSHFQERIDEPGHGEDGDGLQSDEEASHECDAEDIAAEELAENSPERGGVPTVEPERREFFKESGCVLTGEGADHVDEGKALTPSREVDELPAEE